MSVYRLLARLFPRSYRARLLTVVFFCTSLPMQALVVWLLLNGNGEQEKQIVGTTIGLLAMFAGTLVSLFLLYKLLEPLRRAADAVDAYYHSQQLPRLPDAGPDEMGRLMRGINRCLRGVDAGVRQLERHALHDPLTEALNRRGCEQALRDSVARAARENGPFSLVVVDLDNLKPINDEHGHAAGDRALICLVETTRSWLGESDWVGRWGGDEFLVGIHDEPGPARKRVNDWLASLADPGSTGFPVHASAGCACYSGQDAMTLYREADAAMYEAKFAGGNALVCREPTLGCVAAA
ncbi:MAG TPA: diguanylate cyclase [Xanthomonadaceae bacterium]|nr:diguanylate cyclase [Xanthomonadaceae bacterium]